MGNTDRRNLTTYKSTWTEEVRYKKNDIVKRGGNLMKCLVGHTATVGAGGFSSRLRNRWTTYPHAELNTKMYGMKVLYTPAGDLVLYGGYIYKAVTFNTGKSPANYTSDWNPTFEGYNFRGDWNNEGTEDSGEIIQDR